MRKYLFLAVLCSLFSAGAHGQGTQIASGSTNPATCDPTKGTLFFNNSATPGTLYYCSATNTWSVQGSTNNAINPISYGAKFDVRFSGNCTFTISTTVNCTGGDITFTSADVGKIAFGTSSATQVNGTMVTAAGLVIPQTTITAVNSSTQVVVANASTANCTPSTTVSCTFAYGTQDDTTAIQSAQTAAWVTAGAKCALTMPAGAAFVTKALFNIVQSNQCMGSTPNNGVLADITSTGPLVSGVCQACTILIPLPTFDFTSCNTGSGTSCFGTTTNLHAHDFSINGLQQPLGSAHSNVFWESLGGGGGGSCDGGNTLWNLSFSGWGLTSSGSTGFQWGNGMCNDSTLWNVNVSAFGATPCSVIGSGNILNSSGWMCFGGTSTILKTNLATGSVFNSYGSQYTSPFSGTTSVVACSGNQNGVFNSNGDLFAAGLNNSTPSIQSFLICNSGTIVMNIYRGTITLSSGTTGTSDVFQLLGGGPSTVSIRDTKIIATGTNNRLASTAAGNSVVNNGNNTISLGSVNPVLAAATWITRSTVNGACTGTVTASLTTGGIFGTGPNIAATACNAAPNNAGPGTLGVGVPMQGAGNLQMLVVNASAAGTNASSGVVTVMKNGVATTLTCTVGTGTTCTDGTHTVAFVAGDLISFQYTTQAADTLAGLKISVDLNN